MVSTESNLKSASVEITVSCVDKNLYISSKTVAFVCLSFLSKNGWPFLYVGYVHCLQMEGLQYPVTCIDNMQLKIVI